MSKKNIKILAIETSCDETAAAVILGNGKNNLKILSNIVASQIDLHRITHGIVPEVASRAHVEKIIPVIQESLLKSRIKLKDIDLFAVTIGPGLVGSLLVGIDIVRALAYASDKPVISVNHVEAHIYANFVDVSQKFPAIVLVVSGGHTQLILMRGHGNYKVLGSTIDDAAGEAFDKVAKILGLPYPGGPSISEEASKKQKVKSRSIKFPRPMIDTDDFDFSFSGLKTAVLYKVRELTSNRKSPLNRDLITAIAYEFQNAIVDVLVTKTTKAARKYKTKTIMLGGGVAANKLLRSELKKRVKKEVPNSKFYIPAPKFCTDNAAVVGANTFYKYSHDKKFLKNWKKVGLNLNPKL